MLMPPQMLSPGSAVGGQQNPSQLAAALMGRAQMPQLAAPSFGGMANAGLMQMLKNTQQPNNQPILTGPQAMVGASQSDPYQAVNSYNYADNPGMWSQFGSWLGSLMPSGGGQ